MRLRVSVIRNRTRFEKIRKNWCLHSTPKIRSHEHVIFYVRRLSQLKSTWLFQSLCLDQKQHRYHKHNFSPHRYYICNNKDILYKHKSLFLKHWFDNGIILVDQLFNINGFLFTYGEFLEHYKIPVTPRDYAKVFGAISPEVCMLFKHQTRINIQQCSLPNTCIISSYIGNICFSLKSHNSSVRAVFQRDIVFLPYVYSYWNHLTDNIIWKKVWLIPNQYLITNKVKEVSFKIIHRIYPAKYYLVKFKSDIDFSCSVCVSCHETVVHLFWHCPFVKIFWQNVCDFLVQNIDSHFVLFWKYVLFGILENSREKHIHVYMINLILLYAKFHIHKCKFCSKKKLVFFSFRKEMEHYIDTIRFSMKQKVIKTVKVCKRFNFFI